MSKEKITVAKWATYDEALELPESFGGMGGFFHDGMRWGDYIGVFCREVHKYAEALRASIIEKGIKECGPWHQDSSVNGAPIFSDGTAATFSYRAWGDLLAAVWSTEENRDSNYMEFYC